jgi:RNA polymerase sigma-70 factor (ECF subfamily)
LSIAANLARNRRRSIGRQYNALKRIWLAERGLQPSASASIEARMTQRWQAKTLWQAIRRLGWADQEVIYLRYFLEVPVEEVAESLDVAPGTVKSRLHRALGRLREVVERDFPDLGDAAFEAGRFSEVDAPGGRIE